MRNRLMAGLLAGTLIFQSTGTAYAADNAADLSSSNIESSIEAASGGASLVMSEFDDKEETDEAGSGSGAGEGSAAGNSSATGNSSGQGIVEGSSYASSEEKSAGSGKESSGDDAGNGSSDGAGRDNSDDVAAGESSGDASDASSSASSDEDAADAASSENSFPEDYYEENATGFLDVDKGYEIESINDVPNTRKRLFRSVSYPSSYRNETLPALKNQNPYGSCWAFAMIGLSEISLLKNGYSSYDLSELHLAYFAYHSVVDPIGGLEGDDVTFKGSGPLSIGGNSDFAAYTLTRWTGAADEASANYINDAEKAMSGGLDPNIAYDDVAHLTGYYEDKYNIDDLTPLKRMIMDYGAAGINYYAYNSMAAVTTGNVYNSDNNCYYNDESKGANHAVIVVGWDDNFSRSNFSIEPDGDGAWLVRNSWTTGYEESYSGYFWMSYYEKTIDDDIYAIECVPSNMSYDNNYQYDGGLGSSTYRVYEGANVFTASSGCEYGESLEAVSFKTADSNVTYSIEIYSGLSDMSDPKSGVLETTVSGVTAYAGFYEVPLDKKVILEEGEAFSVVVALSKGSETAKLCLESPMTASSSYGTITSVISAPEGIGFYKAYQNSSWKDLGKEHGKTFRIKAYTSNMPSPEVVYPSSVSFDDVVDGKYSLGVNESYRIAYTVAPENASDKTMTWKSSDTGICTVSGNGILTGKCKGTATITGTTVLGNVSASFEVDVDYVLNSIYVTGYSTPIAGKSYKFLAYANPGEYEFKEELSWSSSDPSVATVSSDGTVRALKPGIATIYASADGKTGSVPIKVFVSTDSYEFRVLDDNSIKATWDPVDGATEYGILRGDVLVATLGPEAREYTDTYYVDKTSDGESVTYYFRYVINAASYKNPQVVNIKKRYNINYHLGEGGASNNPDNPALYSYGVAVSLLDPVPAASYYFAGWYRDPEYTVPATRISSKETGDIDLYAKFSKNPVSWLELVLLSDDGKENEIAVGASAEIYAIVHGEKDDLDPENTGYDIDCICNPAGGVPSAEISVSGTDRPHLLVQGKRVGSITVTATSKGLSESGSKVVVKKTFVITQTQPLGIAITPEPGAGVDPKALRIGQQLKLSYEMIPEGAKSSVEVLSADEEAVKVISVNEGYAIVEAVGLGTSYISFVSEVDASARNGYLVTVVDDEESKEQAKEIRITDTSKDHNVYGSSSYVSNENYGKIEIPVGKSFALRAELVNQELFTSRKVSWSSGNSAVATVSSTGKVTAKGAGYAVITVTCEDERLEAACKVNVYAPVTSFALDKKSLKLGRGQSAKINVATLLPTSADDTVRFDSSNKAVATVDDNGVVTAGDVNGTTVITAFTSHGEKTAKCTVTVGNPITSIEVRSKGNATDLAVGKTLQLSAVFNAADSAPQPLNKSVKWEIVEGSSFATINDKGVLKGLKEGFVTVRAVSTTDTVEEERIKDLRIGIYVPVTKAAFSVKTVTLEEGSSYKLKLNLTTPNGDAPTGEEICSDEDDREPISINYYPKSNEIFSWEKDATDPTLVTITVNEYTSDPINLYGFYNVYGKTNSYTSCKIKVVKAGTGISKLALSKSRLTMGEGTTAELSGIFKPMIPKDSVIRWNIDETSDVFFVDETGNKTKEIETGSHDGDGSDNTVKIFAKENALSTGGSVAIITAVTSEVNSTGKPLSAICTVNIKGGAGFIQLKSKSTDITGKALSLAKGKNITLKAAVFTGPDMKSKSGNQKVNWTSSNTSVATVTSSGKIVAVGKGTARIYADTTDAVIDEKMSGDHTDAASYVDVTVYTTLSKLTLDKAKTYMGARVADNVRYSSYNQYDVVTANIASADYYANPSVSGDDSFRKVTWTADNDNIEVMTIDTGMVGSFATNYEKQSYLEAMDTDGNYVNISGGNAIMTGAGQSVAIVARRPGKVKLTATAGGRKAVCIITVYSNVTGLSVAEGRISTVPEGDMSYKGCDYYTDLSLSDKSKKTVTVVPRLQISGVDYSSAKGTAQEKAATAAYNAVKKLLPNSSVNYISSNPSVASVNAKGVVTAKGSGDAIIIVFTSDGMIIKRIFVSVE